MNVREMIRRGVMGGKATDTTHQTLPQNLVSDAITVLEDFETIGDWTASGAVPEDNIIQFVSGSHSVKISSAAGYADNTITKTINMAGSSFKPNMLASIYMHNDPAANVVNSSLYFYLSKFSNCSVAMRCIFPSDVTKLLQDRWVAVDLSKHLWSALSGGSWNDQMVALRFRMEAAAGKSPSLSVDKFLQFTGIPAVMINFDDGFSSVYSAAFPKMAASHVSGNLYVITNLTGSGGYCSVAQLQEMNTAGWSIANHTTDHTDLRTLSQADAQARMANAETALNGWGLTKASKHVAYPFGYTNATVCAALAAAGMLTGRLAIFPNDFLLPGLNLDYIFTSNVSRTTTLATVKGWVDAAKANKKVLSLLFHKIVDVPSIDTEWATSDFNDLIDYIVAQQVQTITIDDLYKLTLGPVSVRMPWA